VNEQRTHWPFCAIAGSASRVLVDKALAEAGARKF
jgi:hypothetical protein